MIRWRWLAAGAASLMFLGCSLIIGSLSDCKSDSDCAAKGAGLVCASGLCVSGGSVDSGLGGDGGGGGDGGCVGSNGCYACPPSTNAQFLNACSSATCVPFDDTRVTLLYPDGGVPPVSPVDAGPPFDAGPLPADSGLPDCSMLGANDGGGFVPAVYVVGSNAALPFLAALGQALYADQSPLALIYQNLGSCAGVGAVLNGDVVAGPANYWDASGNENSCNIGTPLIADLGVSDVFPASCVQLLQGLPPNVGDIFGPIQTMTFVVPAASSQQSISARAAYFTYGFGAGSGVSPWTNAATLFNRNSLSGTQLLLSAGIGLPSTSWVGTDTGTNSKMVSDVAGSADAESTLGILSVIQITPSVGLTLRPLAFKDQGQSCGYLPDSNASSHDKQNVRDGHYALWGPIHFLADVDSNGYVLSPNGKRVMGYITGTDPPPGGVDLVKVEAANNLIPLCAMRVTRSQQDVGPLESYQPADPCGCYFESVATGQTSCKTCGSINDCPGGSTACNFGYCEP